MMKGMVLMKRILKRLHAHHLEIQFIVSPHRLSTCRIEPEVSTKGVDPLTLLSTEAEGGIEILEVVSVKVLAVISATVVLT